MNLAPINTVVIDSGPLLAALSSSPDPTAGTLSAVGAAPAWGGISRTGPDARAGTLSRTGPDPLSGSLTRL